MLIQYEFAPDKILITKNKHLKTFLAFHYQRPTFVFTIGQKKIVNKIIARTKYIEQGVINSDVRYHNEILRANETLSKYSVTAKQIYKALFLEKFKKVPGQFQFGQLTWREFQFSSWCVLFLPMYLLIYLFIYHFKYLVLTIQKQLFFITYTTCMMYFIYHFRKLRFLLFF